MKYKLFLIDLDDTLLDFQASEKLCFYKTFNQFGLDSRPLLEKIHEIYKIENNKLWAQVELGKIEKDFLKIERFKRTLEYFELTLSPYEVSEYYLAQLPLNIVLIDGALDLCQGLKKLGDVGIVTNGIKETQNARIHNSDLKNLIDFVVISDECGYAKPDLRFFEYAMTKSNQAYDKDSILMIGDRLEADILGANHFNIDSLWFNPHEKKVQPPANPTYVVKTLNEILKMLN